MLFSNNEQLGALEQFEVELERWEEERGLQVGKGRVSALGSVYRRGQGVPSDVCVLEAVDYRKG